MTGARGRRFSLDRWRFCWTSTSRSASADLADLIFSSMPYSSDSISTVSRARVALMLDRMPWPMSLRMRSAILMPAAAEKLLMVMGSAISTWLSREPGLSSGFAPGPTLARWRRRPGPVAAASRALRSARSRSRHSRRPSPVSPVRPPPLRRGERFLAPFLAVSSSSTPLTKLPPFFPPAGAAGIGGGAVLLAGEYRLGGAGACGSTPANRTTRGPWSLAGLGTTCGPAGLMPLGRTGWFGTAWAGSVAGAGCLAVSAGAAAVIDAAAAAWAWRAGATGGGGADASGGAWTADGGGWGAGVG